MNKDDKIISDKLKKDLKINQSYFDTIYNTFDKLPEKRKTIQKFTKYRYSIAACCSLILITGVVFAKDIEKIIKNKFNFGSGINTAMENGYVSTPDMELDEQTMIAINSSNKTIDTINVKSKVNSAVMNDTGIGIEFYFEFDSKLNKYVNLGKNTINGNIDYENSHYIEFIDLFIIDEEKRIIYVAPEGKEACYNYYKEQNLDYNNYQRYNSDILNVIGNINNDNPNIIKLSLESTIASTDFPRSQKLSICFSKFRLIPKLGNDEEIEISLESPKNCLFEVNLPEEIYNRTDEYYKVVNCKNDDFNIYEAKLTNTGFEIGLTISNVKEPVYPSRMSEIENSINKSFNGNFSKEGFIEHYGQEYTKLYEKYYDELCLIKRDGINYYAPWLKQTEGCYVLNENEEIFKRTVNGKSGFSFEENKYKYYETFDMTKYDATDKITVVIDFKNTPVYIELEKE